MAGNSAEDEAAESLLTRPLGILWKPENNVILKLCICNASGSKNKTTGPRPLSTRSWHTEKGTGISGPGGIVPGTLQHADACPTSASTMRPPPYNNV